jgi:ubiquinone/menaquinone biosynthesis C-methylase UbiE
MEDVREFKRLSDKVDASAFVEKYITPHGLNEFKILDVGCGSCVIAEALAKSFPKADVNAISNNRPHIEKAKELMANYDNLNVEFADAYDLSYPDNTFDFVFSRFVFEYLKTPQQALREMIRVCKPGGKVMVQDLDMQLITHYPEDSDLQNKISEVLAFLKNQSGFDPFVGRKLYNLFYHAGLKQIEVQVEPYHLFAGTIDHKNLRLWELKLDIALPQIEQALGSCEAAYHFKEQYINYLNREDTFSYSIIMTLIANKIIT